jgi:hypothetical protein
MTEMDNLEIEQGSETFYCLSSDGELYILGNHGDWYAAEDTAKSIGLDPIWVFGESSAEQWRSVLMSTN